MFFVFFSFVFVVFLFHFLFIYILLRSVSKDFNRISLWQRNYFRWNRPTLKKKTKYYGDLQWHFQLFEKNNILISFREMHKMWKKKKVVWIYKIYKCMHSDYMQTLSNAIVGSFYPNLFRYASNRSTEASYVNSNRLGWNWTRESKMTINNLLH